MPRINRGYKRGEPFRDARLFVIACEGAKREKEYFEALAPEHQRVKIQVLAPVKEEDGKSAPKWVIDRAAQYVEAYGLAEDDQLWLVMDTDNWEEKDLRSIMLQCQETPSWFIALSNPCFEVWLYFHIEVLPKLPIMNCQAIKNNIHKKVDGGYKVEVFIKEITEAMERASKQDAHPDYDWPDVMGTKVYRLAKAILEFL
jgi:hypothetical protein